MGCGGVKRRRAQGNEPAENLASSVENARKSVSQFSQDKLPLTMMRQLERDRDDAGNTGDGLGKKVNERNQQLREVIEEHAAPC